MELDAPEPNLLAGGVVHDQNQMQSKVTIQNGYNAGGYELGYNPTMWTDLFMSSGVLENHLWPAGDAPET